MLCPLIVTRSRYVPALTLIVSPAFEALTAFWIVLNVQPLAQTVRVLNGPFGAFDGVIGFFGGG